MPQSHVNYESQINNLYSEIYKLLKQIKPDTEDETIRNVQILQRQIQQLQTTRLQKSRIAYRELIKQTDAGLGIPHENEVIAIKRSKTMGTKADYYIGKGKQAEWIGSQSHDGFPEEILDQFKACKTPTGFKQSLYQFFKKAREEQELEGWAIADYVYAAEGWPWPWKNSAISNAAFFFFDGELWYADKYTGRYYSRKTLQESDTDKRLCTKELKIKTVNGWVCYLDHVHETGIAGEIEYPSMSHLQGEIIMPSAITFVL